MRRVSVVAAAVLLGSLLAGCGGSSHKASSPATTTRPTARFGPEGPPTETTPPANAPPAVRSAFGRVLRAGDLVGFAPQGRRTFGVTPAVWVTEEHLPPAEKANEVKRLERLGWVVGVQERLAPTSGPGEAISIAVRFKTPRAAREDLATEAGRLTSQGQSAFTVTGIPAARGFGGSGGGNTFYNVAFAVGPYYYLVGTGFPTGMGKAPTHQDLIAATQRLYARVQR